MELQLGLALPTHPSKPIEARAYHPNPNPNKRSFSQLFELQHVASHNTTRREVMLPTLSLLPLTPANSSPITKNEDENDVEEAVGGWPPVNSWRKKLRYDNYGDHEVAGNDQTVWILHHHQHGRRGSNTQYVKVKMEGVGIARKVNLGMYHSFQTLKETLMDMFGKCHQQYSNCYELAYQDQEGDWLLADDVPWRSFIQCAQRLKLMKNSR